MTKKKITYRGRKWTLYDNNGIWHFNGMINGRRFHRSLHQTHFIDAAEMARVLIDSIFEDASKEELLPKKNLLTWGGYLEAFETTAGAYVKQKYVHHYRNILAGFLKMVLGENYPNMKTEKPTPHQLEEWKTRYVKSKGPDEHDVAQAKRYCNSMIRQASTFTGETWQTRLGVHLGDGAESIRRCPKYQRVPTRVFRPTDNLIESTLYRAEKELKDLDLNAYKIFWFVMGTGCRRGEVMQVRWEDFDIKSDPVRVIGHHITKDGDESYLQFVYPKAWDLIKPMAPLDWKGSYLSAMSERSRRNGFDILGKFLRDIGWTGRFTVHELRAVVITKVSERHGIAHAQAVARHKNASTTDKYIRRRIPNLPQIDFN